MIRLPRFEARHYAGTMQMRTESRGLTPVETQIGALREALEATTASHEDGFTVAHLIGVLGVHSHMLVLLVFSVLNMIPGPPGYGESLAVAMVGFAVAMLLDAPLALPRWLGERKLPVQALLRVAGVFGRVAGFIGRFSKPRLLVFSAPFLRPALAVFIIVVSVPMALPIPLINAVPNVGLAVLCLSWLNRDGIGVVLGIVIAMIGLGIAVAAIWGAYQLIVLAMGAVS